MHRPEPVHFAFTDARCAHAARREKGFERCTHTTCRGLMN